MPVAKGDRVRVHYTGTLEDGTVFDDSREHGAPLKFEVGAGQLIKGFDDAVVGMEAGDKKDITIPPEEAYGPHDPELIKDVPRNEMPPGDIEPGMMIGVKLPNGQVMPAVIVSVTDEIVQIDFNHQLAGKILNFNLEVMEIVDPNEPDEEPAGCDCGCDHNCDSC